MKQKRMSKGTQPKQITGSTSQSFISVANKKGTISQKKIKPILTPRGRSPTPSNVEKSLGDSSIFKEGPGKSSTTRNNTKKKRVTPNLNSVTRKPKKMPLYQPNLSNDAINQLLSTPRYQTLLQQAADKRITMESKEDKITDITIEGLSEGDGGSNK